MSTALQVDDFPAFFCELWGADRDAFPWQKEFARRICTGDWPKYVAAPTGSGKTACLDAAVFALALQAGLPAQERTAGRRIFFIVNRRVIVDEAYERAGELCRKLINAAPNTVTGRVAGALRSLTGQSNRHPLTRVQLRGGIYRDRSWVGSLLQPMIICSTVDQAGSRLLFRGYGVSDQARPIHAALVAQDSLLIVDEAHISRPFIETLGWVEKFRRYEFTGSETIRLPFQFVQMTGTLPAGTSEAEQIALTDADHKHPVLAPRLMRGKPAQLVVEDKAKGKTREEILAKRLAKEAQQILAEHQPRSLAVMVNRVATARMVYAELKKQASARVTLLIGRLRPLDREALTERIQERLKTRLKTDDAPEDAGGGPEIVVSTQCLEVGADLDFDALVTEAASLDALRQRFGRLNRGGRDITPRAMIVLPADQNLAVDKLDDKKPCDPIYDNAIPMTWHWLQCITTEGFVDFGINAMAAHLKAFREANSEEALARMLSPTGQAPVLLPAYLDCWVQTKPAPAADPDVALFLHGPRRDMAEVQVCWRGDLPETASEEEWTDILSLCPPSTVECLPVPLRVFRDWLGSKGEFKDDSGDVVERDEQVERKKYEVDRGIPALVWRSPYDRFFTQRGAEVRPGDTIVLRVQSGGWQVLGHLPSAPDDPQTTPGKELGNKEVRILDVAESAIASARRRAIVRIHPALWPAPEDGTAALELMEMARNKDQDWRIPEIKELLERLLSDENPGWPLTEMQRSLIKHLTKKGVRLAAPEQYPNNKGFVLTSRDLLANGDEEIADTEADALLEAAQPQELGEHTRDVLARIESSLALLPLTGWREALTAAATVHDWGKVDPRFQAMLRGTTPFAAMASGVVLAKSGSITSSLEGWREGRRRAELPGGFRHEMLSVRMAETAVGESVLPKDEIQCALALHLISTHHGYARPFAPLVDDESPPGVSLPMNGKTIDVTGAERLSYPAHALDSGIAERFWQMNRHYGWWGLAFLETVLRLADQSASAHPQTTSKS